MTTQDENSITNCIYEEKDVGKAIKSTKRKFRWEFRINTKDHFVELYDSKLTGKKKIICDSQIILQPKVVRGLFTYSFYIDTHIISILQNGNSFECRIDNLPFNHLLNLQKNKKVYTKDGTSPITHFYKNQAPEENPASKFQLTCHENKSQKENTTSNIKDDTYCFAIKPRRPTNNSDHSEEGRFHFKKMEDFISNSNQNMKNSNTVNLLDFDMHNGSRPTTINILDLSPLNSPKEKKQIKDNDVNFYSNKPQDENGENKKQECPNPKETSYRDNITVIEAEEKSIPSVQSELQQNFNDINFFFEVVQAPKETSKVEKIKEVYNSKFEENEGMKVDKIYNLFGGPSFSSFYSPFHGVKKAPNINNSFDINLSKNNSSQDVSKNNNKFKSSNSLHISGINTASSSTGNSSNNKPNMYPSFDDMHHKYEINLFKNLNLKEKRESSNDLTSKNQNQYQYQISTPSESTEETKAKNSSSNDVFNLFN